ncbi:hypothetical protein ACJJTC_009502 [Scirpophaga incertulas]
MPIRSMSSARQAESKLDDTMRKLDLALKELDISKKFVEQLLKERDDNESELISTMDKYNVLKKQMTGLHTEYRLCIIISYDASGLVAPRRRQRLLELPAPAARTVSGRHAPTDRALRTIGDILAQHYEIDLFADGLGKVCNKFKQILTDIL